VEIALDRKLISSLDEPISTYIPEFNKNKEPFHKLITIRHLLTMSSGIFWNGGIHYHCPLMIQMRRSKNWISHISDCMMKDFPGTKYNYKEWDVILLAKILDNTCKDTFDFINENIYKPLEIKSERWFRSDCGVYYSVGTDEENGNTSNLSAHSLLKIGQLFLQDGIYNQKRIVASDYIKEAITPSPNNSGYGYLWWLGKNWYGCRGYGGQSITVFPENERIIVTQATPTSRVMSYDDVIWFSNNAIQAEYN